MPLAPAALRAVCDPLQFDFKTTDAVDPLTDVIGQDRAVEAVRFGVGIRRPGFNVFAFGPPGSGKHTVVHHYLALQAAAMPAADAWCYVFNFDEAPRPQALRLPRGRATALRNDLHALVEELLIILPTVFDSDAYALRREGLSSGYETRSQAQFDVVAERAAQRGLALVRGPEGAGLVPLSNGEVMSPDAYAALPPDRQVALRSVVEDLNPELEAAMRVARVLERESREAVSALDREVASAEIRLRMGELVERYGDLPEVLAYLNRLADDILDHLDDFRAVEDMDGPSADGAAPVHHDAAAAARWRRRHDARFRRYDVNVLVDAPEAEGAPVVVESHPTLGNLVGRIEQRPEYGTLVTDFSLIKPGALHRANGGFLILQAEEVLKQPFSWDALKRALRHGEIRIEAQSEESSPFGTTSLMPEPIPLDCKVVLIGEHELYFDLAEMDPDIHELWKVPAEFADSMPRNAETTTQFAAFLATLARRQGLLPLTRQAVALLVEEAARRIEDARRLSTCFMETSDIVCEADHWARQRATAATIEAADIEVALAARERRADLAREQVRESFERRWVLLDTTGTAVGRVNGLTVLTRGRFHFGVPMRISARVRLGGGELVDIEREVQLGGPLHSKGVLILGGFLNGRYLPDETLAIAASLTFEQSYGEIEGDSASAGELCALLSAISGIPLRQDLAITGSVNQEGELQAVSGVNEKIEGFYDVCAAAGLSGGQGVLIPQSNLDHLMLRPDVVAAAAAGRFHVYAVAHVDEALALLSDRPAGERDSDAEYPPESFNRAVEDRLRILAEKRRESRGDEGGGEDEGGSEAVAGDCPSAVDAVMSAAGVAHRQRAARPRS